MAILGCVEQVRSLNELRCCGQAVCVGGEEVIALGSRRELSERGTATNLLSKKRDFQRYNEIPGR